MGGVLGISCLQAAPVSFYGQSGNHSALNGALDGVDVADQLGLSPYDGFIGQLALIPADPTLLSYVTAGTAGMITADGGGAFSDLRGLAGFCIDSETTFLTSSGTGFSQLHGYEAHNFSSADSRYLSDGVNFYLAGGLKKAAYLLETFYGDAHGGGDEEAAALQAAIWDVLYDSSHGVGLNDGNYYLRTNAGNRSARNTANAVANQANDWLDAAAAANWGGTGYDPANRVIFWLDPEDTQLNQSIITLNPGNWQTVAVPEPGAPAMLAGGLGFLLLLRRRGWSPG